MPKLPITRYTASFTAGSLLYEETSALLPLILSDQREQKMRQEIKNNQYLHINSESARKRTISEIIKRVQNTDRNFWSFYMSSSIDEQKLLLFYVCLKTYPLMFDFHFNVTLKQWNSSSQTIEPYFYLMELEEISARDEVVYGWTDSTKRKTVSVYMRIIKEIKMLTIENQLHPVHMDDHFWQFFVSNRATWFLDAILLSVHDKERIMQL